MGIIQLETGRGACRSLAEASAGLVTLAGQESGILKADEKMLELPIKRYTRQGNKLTGLSLVSQFREPGRDHRYAKVVEADRGRPMEKQTTRYCQ